MEKLSRLYCTAAVFFFLCVCVCVCFPVTVIPTPFLVLLAFEFCSAAEDSLSAISPLSLACLSGQASLVQLLLCAAATIDGPEGHGGAPLLHAAYKNFASICEILLDSGANPHVAFTKSGHIQLEIPAAKTPLHDDHWHRILCEPSQGGSSLQQLRTEGVTALHLAAWHGSARTCHWAKNAGCFWYIVFV